MAIPPNTSRLLSADGKESISLQESFQPNPDQPKPLLPVGQGAAGQDGLTFWLLLTLGLILIGACMVIPSWIQRQQLRQQKQELVRQFRWAAAEYQKELQAIRAAERDVSFNERLLIEELNYGRPGEEVLLRGPVKPKTAPEIGRRQSYATPFWARGFARKGWRHIMLLLAVGLVVLAFVRCPAPERSAKSNITSFLQERPTTAESLLPGQLSGLSES